MKRMNLSFLVAVSCVGLLGMVSMSCKHVDSNRGGWRTVLDVNHTNGWRMVGPGEFKVEGDALVTYGGMGMLAYEKEKLGDCQIKVVFKLTGEADNSGVFIRIPEKSNDPWFAVNNGYEVQIANQGDEWHRTGVLYSFTKAQNAVNPKVGEWSTMLITLHGKRTVVEVNDVLVMEFFEGQSVPQKKIWYEPERRPRPETGYIGLQNHGGDAHVHFKEVSVRPLHH
jgi:hypothetical protein